MSDAHSAAREFSTLFPAVYLRFHRRDAKRPAVGPQAWAVLQHLAWSGPLTVTEAATHMRRAQSAMSEILDSLETKGLVARMPDARDRRRTLVWLTDDGQALLEREREVLSLELLEPAFAKLTSAERAGLVAGMRALSEVEVSERKSVKEKRK